MQESAKAARMSAVRCKEAPQLAILLYRTDRMLLICRATSLLKDPLCSRICQGSEKGLAWGFGALAVPQQSLHL